MSDDIVIQIVYISIGPFFIADPQMSGKGRSEKAVKGKTAEAAMGVLGGKSGLRELRMAALGLLRTVSWMMGSWTVVKEKKGRETELSLLSIRS